MSTTPQHPSPTVHIPAGIPEQTWLAAVHAEVVSLKSTIYAGRRLDEAQALVLTGAVSQDAAGHWQVASRTTPGVQWPVNGTCACPDAEHNAPDGLCAHRLAVGITRRALKAVGSQAMAAVHDSSCITATPQAATAALPEAAFSITLKGHLSGHEVLLTARGQSFDEFRANVARLQGMLDPAPPAATQAPPAMAQPTPEGWCVLHGVEMPLQTNDRGSWRSHKTADGWCKGKPRKGA